MADEWRFRDTNMARKLRRVAAERDEYRALLRELEWSGSCSDGIRSCPSCGGCEPDDRYGAVPPTWGHRRNCRLAIAIGREREGET